MKTRTDCLPDADVDNVVDKELRGLLTTCSTGGCLEAKEGWA